MLEANVLRDKLRAFADADYAGFTAFPPSRDAARTAWAQAFSEYFDAVEEDLTGAPPGHLSLGTSGVQAAFRSDLGLDLTTSAAAAAADFAGAWGKAIDAITFASTLAAGYTWTPTGFIGVAGLQATLQATLAALFADVLGDPPATAIGRLGAIADAFHAASSNLVATAQKANSSSTVPTTMPLA